MENCRIIIADTDINYLLPLQLKFVEEFGDKINLEIITDRTYFQTLFSTPQEVGVMIVSEDLFDPSLQKHFIDHIFLMTEQYADAETGSLKVNRLYKYTSIKEIFTEITGVSAAILAGKKTVKNEPKILLVTSACGGTGKTTVAMGICEALAKAYRKVLYINADRLQTFQYLLQDPDAGVSNSAGIRLAYSGENAYQDVRNEIRKESFSYLPAFRAPLLSLGLEYGVFHRIAQSARDSGEYDFVVVDADPVFDENKVQMMNIADKVLVVTKQTRASVLATNFLAASINGVQSGKYLFVCNDFDREKENYLASADSAAQFPVSEYVERIDNYCQAGIQDFSKDRGIQRLAILVS